MIVEKMSNERIGNIMFEALVNIISNALYYDVARIIKSKNVFCASLSAKDKTVFEAEVAKSVLERSLEIANKKLDKLYSKEDQK